MRLRVVLDAMGLCPGIRLFLASPRGDRAPHLWLKLFPVLHLPSDDVLGRANVSHS